jgi:hypothetical protein
MTLNSKISYVLKKLLGRRFTWSNKEWFEEEPISTQNIHAKNVWVDEIPNEPNVDLDYIEKLENIKLQKDKSTQNSLAYKMVDENGNYITNLIPPSYGFNYSAKIKINGKKIPTSHPTQPFFDYETGTLTFDKNPMSDNITIDVFKYNGKTIEKFIKDEENTIAKGILGIDEPKQEYVIQHNFNSFDLLIDVYAKDIETDENDNQIEVWKKDIIPITMIDVNRIRVNLSHKTPIRFMIKSF